MLSLLRPSLDGRISAMLLNLWQQKNCYTKSGLCPVVVNTTLTRQALTVVISLPVGLSPDNLIKLGKEISYALGGEVEITTKGRAVYIVRWLIEMPTLVPFNPPDLSDYRIPIWLGKDRRGSDLVVDLAADETFSMLIGGLPGLGKTNLIKSMLATWEDTDQIRISGIDLKGGVELASLEHHPAIKHLAFEPEEVEPIVTCLISQMAKREQLFREAGVNCIARYKGDLPRHVLLIDEYADLTDQKNDQLQRKIFKILRRGRAFGIHTVLCSQRLTGDVINTSLRNMFPCAVAFRVAKREDSEAILSGHGEAADLPPVKGRCVYMCGPDLTVLQTPLAPNN